MSAGVLGVAVLLVEVFEELAAGEGVVVVVSDDDTVFSARFLEDIKSVAVEATRVPSPSVEGLEAANSRREAPTSCRLRVSAEICEDDATLLCRVPL